MEFKFLLEFELLLELEFLLEFKFLLEFELLLELEFLLEFELLVSFVDPVSEDCSVPDILYVSVVVPISWTLAVTFSKVLPSLCPSLARVPVEVLFSDEVSCTVETPIPCICVETCSPSNTSLVVASAAAEDVLSKLLASNITST